MLTVEGRKRGILVEWRVPSRPPAFVEHLVAEKPDILIIGSKERLDRFAYAGTGVK